MGEDNSIGDWEKWRALGDNLGGKMRNLCRLTNCKWWQKRGIKRRK